MRIIKAKDYKEMSKIASEIIIREIKNKPNFVAGFASGKTPKGLYKELVKLHKKGRINFSKAKAFGLDEYYPIKKNDIRSFHFFLNKFFKQMGIKESNRNLLNGEAKNPVSECRSYEEKIKKNPIDVVILGVGVNGHIAFNEPGTDANSRIRVINLSKDTIKRNSESGKAPDKALTIGAGTILKSKKIILLASGKEKAEAVKHLIKGKMSKNWPVSFLKKHKDLTVIIDKEAGTLVK
jgi:glucosamine-6-phosphate deaminase